jgi:hypothetical protein
MYNIDECIIQQNIINGHKMDEWEAIKTYFLLGLSQDEILYSLCQNHGITMSKRTLKRRLKALQLYRKNRFTDIIEEACTIEELLQGHCQLRGHRLMHLEMQQRGFVVSRQTIRDLLSLLDPNGVESRKRHRLRRRQYFNEGSNYLWHIDGYDKLKPYGIAIHGCIDGYSRFVIWLEAWHTNNDPKITAGYYWLALHQYNGCPSRVRSDRGTENVVIADMQKFLRRNHKDDFCGEKSFLYGTSQHNQRIESWWCFLRKSTIQFYVNIFEEMKNNDEFDGDFLDKNLIRFCFMNLIQV